MLAIKERATKLFEKLSGTDIHNDEKYYRLYEDFDNLKRDFLSVREDIDCENKRPACFDIDQKELDILLDEIFELIKQKKNITIEKNFPSTQEGYGDYVDIDLTWGEEASVMDVKEMHDKYFYDNNLVEELKNILNQFGINIDYHEHFHGFGAMEYNMECILENKNSEELLDLIKKLIEVIKETKRKVKIQDFT